ncbi:MAG: PDZ domain-containing protein [Flavisolibacter sp.]
MPCFIFAQKEKDEKIEKIEKRELKEGVEKKENKEIQTIVITRSGSDEGKTLIEIDGDKIKINGKKAEDSKDVQVNIHKINPGHGMMAFNNMNLFSEDQNRAMLGVMTENDNKGAVVQSVNKESAAEKAGLKKGDIITKIGQDKIEGADNLTKVIRDHKPGEKVTIEILRDGKEQKLTAELGKWKGIKMNQFYMPRMEEFNRKMEDFNGHMGQLGEVDGHTWNTAPAMPPMDFNFSNGERPKLGLSIQDTDDGKGVKILNVEEESNAAKAGLKDDDIITKIDDKDVHSTEEVRHILREKKENNGYTFRVLREGKSLNMAVKIPRKLKTADL